MDDGVLGERARVRAAEGASPIRLVAGCAISAGFIHAVALVQHLREALLYGAFFAVVAACQVAWGVWAFRRPEHTRSVAAVAIANLAVALIWGISRTTGVPLVPEVGQREAPGLIDLFATFDELGIVVLVIAILRPSVR